MICVASTNKFSLNVGLRGLTATICPRYRETSKVRYPGKIWHKRASTTRLTPQCAVRSRTIRIHLLLPNQLGKRPRRQGRRVRVLSVPDLGPLALTGRDDYTLGLAGLTTTSIPKITPTHTADRFAKSHKMDEENVGLGKSLVLIIVKAA